MSAYIQLDIHYKPANAAPAPELTPQYSSPFLSTHTAFVGGGCRLSHTCKNRLRYDKKQTLIV